MKNYKIESDEQAMLKLGNISSKCCSVVNVKVEQEKQICFWRRIRNGWMFMFLRVLKMKSIQMLDFKQELLMKEKDTSVLHFKNSLQAVQDRDAARF